MCIFENAFIPLKGKFSQDSYKSTFSFFLLLFSEWNVITKHASLLISKTLQSISASLQSRG